MEGLNRYKFIKDLDVEGKTLIVRADLNSNVVKREVVLGDRIKRHAKALNELSKKGAKLVVLSHQGRHRQDDYTSLKQHSELMQDYLGREVLFHPIDDRVGEAIKEMEKGEIMLLENTRFMFEEKMKLTPEEHSKHAWIRIIAENADAFVQDALSICHRQHASVIGFCPLLPSYVGPILEKELKEIENQLSTDKHPKVFVLGGFKIDEAIAITRRMLEENKTDYVLCGGMLGKTFLKAKGISFGAEDKFLEEKGFIDFIPETKEILEKFEDKIILPEDFAVEEEEERKEIKLADLPIEKMLFDIGNETIVKFRNIINDAQCITLNGPMGMFENMNFIEGTRRVFVKIVESKAHTIAGGGQTLEAVKALGISSDKFDLLSLAGGALILYLSGRELPGLECLKE